MARNILVGIATVLLALLPAGLAHAQNTTWYVSGTFTAPATGSFSGSYVIDGGGAIVSANIRVTAGRSRDGSTDLPANTYIYAGEQTTTVLTFATALPADNNRGGLVSVNGTLDAPTSVNTFRDGVCTSPNCSSSTQSMTGGRIGTGTVSATPPAAVPTLSEWAMILLSVMLAGGAVVMIQRRHLTA